MIMKERGEERERERERERVREREERRRRRRRRRRERERERERETKKKSGDTNNEAKGNAKNLKKAKECSFKQFSFSPPLVSFKI